MLPPCFHLNQKHRLQAPLIAAWRFSSPGSKWKYNVTDSRLSLAVFASRRVFKHLFLISNMAEAARIALRKLAASANALNNNHAMHTPIVVGSLAATCVASWAYGAAFKTDST
jgi:hypothetical protein